MQEMTKRARGAPSGPVALIGCWLLFEVLAFLLFMDAMPDFFLVHNIDISGREFLAWAAAFSSLALLLIAYCERRFNMRLLPRIAALLVAIWAAAFLYVALLHALRNDVAKLRMTDSQFA